MRDKASREESNRQKSDHLKRCFLRWYIYTSKLQIFPSGTVLTNVCRFSTIMPFMSCTYFDNLWLLSCDFFSEELSCLSRSALSQI